MFKYDPNKVPNVELENEWMLTTGESSQLYRVGDWSMELPSDGDMQSAETAIYAWIAWYDFLNARKSLNDQEE